MNAARVGSSPVGLDGSTAAAVEEDRLLDTVMAEVPRTRGAVARFEADLGSMRVQLDQVQHELAMSRLQLVEAREVARSNELTGLPNGRCGGEVAMASASSAPEPSHAAAGRPA